MENVVEIKGGKIKDYLIPVLLQFAALFLFMSVHRVFIGKGKLILESVTVGDEVTSPTMGRLIYMIIAFIMFMVMAVIANRCSKSKDRKNVVAGFWAGIVSGTFLWQSLGEDSWHFGVNTEEGLVNISQMESISVVFIMIVFLIFLFYVIKQNALSFGVEMTICSFLCNWLSHYVILASYPFVHKLFEERTWIILSGCIIGGLLFVGSIVYVFKKADNIKKLLLCSTFTYIGIGMITLSIMEG